MTSRVVVGSVKHGTFGEFPSSKHGKLALNVMPRCCAIIAHLLVSGLEPKLVGALLGWAILADLFQCLYGSIHMLANADLPARRKCPGKSGRLVLVTTSC